MPTLRLTLRSKFLVFAVALVLVPGVLFGVLVSTAVTRALERSIGRQLAEVAHDTASEMTDLFEREARNLRTWAAQDVMHELLTGDPEHRLARSLKAIQQSGNGYLRLDCFDTQGRIIATTSDDPSHSAADPLVVHAVLNGQELLAGPTGGRPQTVLQVATPVIHDELSPNPIGGLYGEYDWQRLTSLAARIQRSSRRLKFPVDIFIVDESSRVIVEAPASPNAVSLVGVELRERGWRSARQAAAEERPGFVVDPVANALVGFTPLQGPGAPWRVLVSQPLSSALEPITQLQQRLSILFGVIVLAAAAVAWFLAHRMSRPLRALTLATRQMTNQTGPLPAVKVTSSDEIGELAESFNRMSAELKAAQEDLVTAAKFAFVGEVAAGIAHEVRTPLGIMRSSAQLLVRNLPADRPESSELLEMIVSEVDRLDRVVAGLLELTRHRAPRIDAHGLATILRRALDFIEPQAREQEIEVEGHFDVPAVAACDADLMYQVALNLLVNALQVLAGQAVGTERRIRVATIAEKQGMVGFQVADNGPGIKPELQERIFAPFFTGRPGGTGLGLALVQRVIQEHHGRIEVESTPGGGATFRVWLPAAWGSYDV